MSKENVTSLWCGDFVWICTMRNTRKVSVFIAHTMAIQSALHKKEIKIIIKITKQWKNKIEIVII